MGKAPAEKPAGAFFDLGGKMVVWKRVTEQRAGYIFSLSDSISIVEWRYPGLLEPVDSGVMTLVSDYSGQHAGASHEAYSFLVTTDRYLQDWLPQLSEFRKRWLPDGRRLSFKQLREPLRRRALGPFLETASALRGNLITFLIDHRIKSFADGNGGESIIDTFPDCFSANTKPTTAEKIFRVASLLAMLIAGFRREDQRSLWISDHDEVLETFDRREGFGRLSSYLTFGLTGWMHPADQIFGTTEAPESPEWAEDAASIPDLVAGAYCILSNILPTYEGTELWNRSISPIDIDKRAHFIGDWMAAMRGQLKPVLARLELGDDGAVHASAQFFRGYRHQSLIWPVDR